MAPTLNSTMINIRCIRNSTSKKNASRDDCITIKPAGAGKFTLSYTYGCAVAKRATVATLDDRSVWRYVRALLRNLEADADPFEYLQLELPLMPTFLYRIDKLASNYNDILNAIELQLDLWTATAAAEDDNESLAESEVTEEYEEDEDEDEEDEYADMPPLLPAAPNYAHHRHLFFDEDGDVRMAYN
jgi:hypothetical protein